MDVSPFWTEAQSRGVVNRRGTFNTTPQNVSFFVGNVDTAANLPRICDHATLVHDVFTAQIHSVRSTPPVIRPTACPKARRRRFRGRTALSVVLINAGPGPTSGRML